MNEENKPEIHAVEGIIFYGGSYPSLKRDKDKGEFEPPFLHVEFIESHHNDTVEAFRNVLPEKAINQLDECCYPADLIHHDETFNVALVMVYYKNSLSFRMAHLVEYYGRKYYVGFDDEIAAEVTNPSKIEMFKKLFSNNS